MQPLPPGTVGAADPLPLPAPPPAPPKEPHIIAKVLLGALPIVVGGVAVYYLTQHRDKKLALKHNPARLAEGKARFTGWTCVSGPAELVDYLVEHGTSVNYREFAKHVDVKSLNFWHPSTDWSITWLRTRLPSGKEAWVAQHSGIEHLCTFDGHFDHDQEASLARQWADRQAG